MAVAEKVDWAHELAGNWRKFECFSWSRAWNGEVDDPDNWGIIYTGGRDASLLQESNEEAIRKELDPHIESGDVIEEYHRHWAVGYVTGFAIRVFDDRGEITEAAWAVKDLQERLEDYPVLDEEDFCNREYEAEHEYIEQYGCPRGLEMVDDLPEDWVHQVWEWLWNANEEFIHEGNSVYMSEDTMREALLDLGFAHDEE